ncbi:pilus assembly protein [Sphingomonas ginkgonis]|uniref:Pilus assembly protein n=1 Tax=Sphingomonas ginkgonis TaxID=2315330 RepID=A0A429V6Z0_9SPHN|nr:TadE family protein [Sphingomonas ginkgonis]RST29695.1 pilus assembly protein [Sphingomonas ginkgonis]
MIRLLRDQRGGSAAEFALLTPLLLTLLFGIIDAGRLAWLYNQAEKAAQAGARVAVVTTLIPSNLASFKYVGQTVNGVTYTQGDPLQPSALGTITCAQPAATLSCSCTPTAACPVSMSTVSAAGFNAVVSRVTAMLPQAGAANVTVQYEGSGLGYAGDPSGMDISPLVTVRVSGLQFQPLSGYMLLSVTVPALSSTLSAEDSLGAYSN